MSSDPSNTHGADAEAPADAEDSLSTGDDAAFVIGVSRLAEDHDGGAAR